MIKSAEVGSSLENQDANVFTALAVYSPCILYAQVAYVYVNETYNDIIGGSSCNNYH